MAGTGVPDRRSAAALAYRRLYNTAAWRHIRRAQLARMPLCEVCTQRGLVVPATVVNHRVAHRGDTALFADPANLQSTCAHCHDSEIQSRERTGRTWDSAIGADGLPSDPTHPWYGGKG